MIADTRKMPKFFFKRASTKVRRHNKDRPVQSLPNLRSDRMSDDIETDRSEKFNSRSSFKRLSMKRLRRAKSARKAPKQNKRITKESIGSPNSTDTLESRFDIVYF